MKNKNGFTLVEITISVTLLSAVMVFLLGFVSEVRKDEDSITLRTEMLLNKNIIAKTINQDIRGSGGIKSQTCSNTKCTITLNNNITKTIEITNEGTLLTYKNTTTDKIELTRKLPDNYIYNIKSTENTAIYLITIEVDSYPEYNIDIVNNKI